MNSQVAVPFSVPSTPAFSSPPNPEKHTPSEPFDLLQLARTWGLAPVLRARPVHIDQSQLTCVARGERLALWAVSGEEGATQRRLDHWHAIACQESASPVVLVARDLDARSITVAASRLGAPGFCCRSFPDHDQQEIERLESLGQHASSPELLLFELEDLLSRRALGRAFVKDFRAAWETLAGAWTGVPVAAREDRRELAFTTLIRLLFLAFIQNRGWLDGDSGFIEARIAETAERGVSVYRDFLKALFFEVLNTPRAERTAEAKALGAIPYLNGGLFCPHEVERRYPDRDLPNEVFVELFESLLGPYVFRSSELELEGEGEHATEARHVIDPRMLGHVFEALMADDDRSRSGSFYTPRRVVRRIVSEALVELLHAELDGTLRLDAPESGGRGLENGQLRRALKSLIEDNDASAFSREECERIDAFLHDVRILDPAAGSGAFVIGAFEVLVSVREALSRRAGLEHHADGLRRHVATHNVYGVDLLPAAMRLCELRLWLALSVELTVEDVDSIPPLPNLDLRLRQGDSLLEARQLDAMVGVQGPDLSHDPIMMALKERYLNAVGYEKATLARCITDKENEHFGEIMTQACDALRSQLNGFDRLERAPLLFGQPRGLSVEEERARRQVGHRLAELEQASAAVSSTGMPCFSYPLHFGEVFRHGGFDLVVGNPPWVRSHHQKETSKDRLRARYQVCHRSAWGIGSRLGGGIKAAQVDLAAVFVERALQLARPGGMVALLLPSKLMSSLSSGGLRRFVDEHANVRLIIDWSRAKETLFSATTYPSFLLLERQSIVEPEPAPKVRIEVVQPEGQHHCFQVMPRDLGLFKGDPSSPWLLSPPAERLELDRILATGPGLGTRFDLRRGIVTGCNQAFIPESVVPLADSSNSLLRFADGREAEVESCVLRALLRGSDIAPYRAVTSQQLLFTHAEDGSALPALPPRLAEALGARHAELAKRADLRSTMPIWSLFRVHSDLFAPKVVWRDISQQLEAAFIPANEALLPLNTAYYTAVKDADEGYLLAALLNSGPARRLAAAIAEHARGDYRRYFSWVVGLLPWPFDQLSVLQSQRLVQASRRLHGHGRRSGRTSAEDLALIDELVGLAYRLEEKR
ncbi:MAG: hypothetical protein AUK47_11140 [Deltaproteobacteria bacterium CG2_30_63_29]|nr:MAG: hypothetical protein AUK47_11140 [Deltaproteobacteria bacterium CG2_30_63_29]